MNNNNNNNTSTQKRKLCNPRANAPAVYIPCWLSQVSIKLLSHGAKICYGRLSQWANSKGIVYRSCNQLAAEIGVSLASIEKYLKELRDQELIGTFQVEAGGVNHYEFYDHPWMHEPINEHLSYNDVPPDKSGGTPRNIRGYPPEDLTGLNKRNKKNTKPPISPKGDVAVDNFSEQGAQEPFEEFWRIYPNKKGKKPAKDRWKRRNLDDKLPLILSKLKQQVTEDDSWKRGFIPNPLTYINQERWDDEITKSNKQSCGKQAYQQSIRREQTAASEKSEEIVCAQNFQVIANKALALSHTQSLLMHLNTNGR
jgi:hypothetical protein